MNPLGIRQGGFALSDSDLNFFENYRHPDQFGQLLGYKVDRFDRESRQAEVILTIRDEHLSSSRKVHGGVISALLDFACGAAVCTTLASKDLCSTVELKVNYFYPVSKGAELRAKAEVVFRGKKLCATTVALFAAGVEEPVAMASATYNVVTATVDGGPS